MVGGGIIFLKKTPSIPFTLPCNIFNQNFLSHFCMMYDTDDGRGVEKLKGAPYAIL